MEILEKPGQHAGSAQLRTLTGQVQGAEERPGGNRWDFSRETGTHNLVVKLDTRKYAQLPISKRTKDYKAKCRAQCVRQVVCS